MKRSLPAFLLSACCICALIGCVKQAEPGPGPLPVIVLPAPAPIAKTPPKEQPAEPPRPEVAPPTWLEVSPMRTKMRSMWVSCGEINAMASGAFGIIDFDTLETNAGNIARKAKEFGDMWQAIRDANREMATRAKDGDWFEARFQSQRVWKSCTDCHVENWSLHTRGFLPDTFQGWLKNGNSTDSVPYGTLRLSSTPEYLQIMYRMVAHLDRAVGAVESNDADVVLSQAQSIHGVVNEQLEYWRAIERHANKIVESASRGETTGIDASYGKLIENCQGCHDSYVKDDRAPLNPLPWKYR